MSPTYSTLHSAGAADDYSRSLETPPRYQGLALLGWVALCFTAALTSVFVSTEGWYEVLAKPSWNPPPWVFGPVWSVLYVAMAVAAWLVWRRGGWRAQNLALSFFVAQLALNALWTPLFFGLHQPGFAFADIALLWMAILITALLFFRTSVVAGWLMAPYLAWVSFAMTLNYAIWQMN